MRAETLSVRMVLSAALFCLPPWAVASKAEQSSDYKAGMLALAKKDLEMARNLAAASE